jgi:hypothetical protein
MKDFCSKVHKVLKLRFTLAVAAIWLFLSTYLHYYAVYNFDVIENNPDNRADRGSNTNTLTVDEMNLALSLAHVSSEWKLKAIHDLAAQIYESEHMMQFPGQARKHFPIEYRGVLETSLENDKRKEEESLDKNKVREEEEKEIEKEEEENTVIDTSIEMAIDLETETGKVGGGGNDDQLVGDVELLQRGAVSKAVLDDDVVSGSNDDQTKSSSSSSSSGISNSNQVMNDDDDDGRADVLKDQIIRKVMSAYGVKLPPSLHLWQASREYSMNLTKAMQLKVSPENNNNNNVNSVCEQEVDGVFVDGKGRKIWRKKTPRLALLFIVSRWGGGSSNIPLYIFSHMQFWSLFIVQYTPTINLNCF